MKKLLPLLTLILLITGCATKKKKTAEPTGQATLIGMIEMVNPEQNYVLIRCEQMPNLGTGTELISVSADGKKTKLRLSPERKGHYITADIKEGRPTINSLVLLPAGVVLPPAPPPPPAPVAVPTAPPRSPGLPELPFIPLDLPPATTKPVTTAIPVPEEPTPNLGELEPPVK